MLHTCLSTHPFVFKLHLIYSVCMLHNVIKQRNVMRVFILLFGNNYYVTWIQNIFLSTEHNGYTDSSAG